MDDGKSANGQTQQSEQGAQSDKAPARPSHIAYHVRQADEGKAFFNRVGSAFAHKDGKGFNVLLDASPVDGKITLRTAADRLKDAKSGKTEKSAQRGREDER